MIAVFVKQIDIENPKHIDKENVTQDFKQSATPSAST